MDVVRFRLHRGDDADSVRTDLIVNDVPLPELIRAFELRFSGANRYSAYGGIFAFAIHESPLKHYTGSPDSHLACGPRDKTVLMTCECGEVGCWPLMVRITVTSETAE